MQKIEISEPDAEKHIQKAILEIWKFRVNTLIWKRINMLGEFEGARA